MTGPGLTRNHSEHLFNDAYGLAHFFHTAEVTVVAVAVDADGNVEIHFVVHFVRLFLTHIPFHAGTAQHDAGKAFLHGALGRDDADADGTLFPNAVVSQEGFECIDVFWETFAEGVDEVEHGAFTGFVKLLQYFGIAEFAALVFGHEIGQVAGKRRRDGSRRRGIRAPDTASYKSISSSRSRKAKGWRIIAPMSKSVRTDAIK